MATLVRASHIMLINGAGAPAVRPSVRVPVCLIRIHKPPRRLAKVRALSPSSITSDEVLLNDNAQRLSRNRSRKRTAHKDRNDRAKGREQREEEKR